MPRISTAEIAVNGRRKIVNADDPRALAQKGADDAKGQGLRKEEGRAEEVTRTNLARMKRGDVLDMLEAHGITEGDVEGVMLPELRAMAARVIFTDL